MIDDEFTELEPHELRRDLKLLYAERDEWKARAEKAEKKVLELAQLTLDQQHFNGRLIQEAETAELALAAAQTHALELRAALRNARAFIHTVRCGVSLHTGDCKAATAAISAPQDTTALREFGLKVAHEVSKSHDRNGNPELHKVIVDDVLKGAE